MKRPICNDCPLTPPTKTTMTDPETKPDPFFAELPPTIVEGIAEIQIRVFVDGAPVLGRDATKVFCAVIAAQLESLWNSQSFAVMAPPAAPLDNAQPANADEPTV